MTPRIAIVVPGSVVQEVASDTPDVLVKLLEFDAIEEGESLDDWQPPDTIISDPHVCEHDTSGGHEDATG
jgi:hypothetical protein